MPFFFFFYHITSWGKLVSMKSRNMTNNHPCLLQYFQIQITSLCLQGFSLLSRPTYIFAHSKKHLTNNDLTGWKAGQRETLWGSTRASAKSYTQGRMTTCISTGWGLSCWKGTLQRRTQVSLLTVGWLWVSSASCGQECQ